MTIAVGEDGGAAIALRQGTEGSPQLEQLRLPLLTDDAVTVLTDTWFEVYNAFHGAIGADAAVPGAAIQAWNGVIEATLVRLDEIGLGALRAWLQGDLGLAPGSPVLLSLPGLLSLLPVAAAGSGSGCLLDRYPVSLIANAGLLPQMRATVTGCGVPRYLSVTDPRDDLMAHQPVPWQRGTALRGAAATIPAVTAALRRHSHLVYYGHGGWTGERSVLELADGLLDDAALRRLSHDGLRLVILAGCETGLMDLGARDEMRGLVEAFLQGGAAGVIATLWPVSAAATATVLQPLLARLDAGASPAEALRQVQLALRDGRVPAGSLMPATPRGANRPAHDDDSTMPALPFHWASFVAAGL